MSVKKEAKWCKNILFFTLKWRHTLFCCFIFLPFSPLIQEQYLPVLLPHTFLWVCLSSVDTCSFTSEGCFKIAYCFQFSLEEIFSFSRWSFFVGFYCHFFDWTSAEAAINTENTKWSSKQVLPNSATEALIFLVWKQEVSSISKVHWCIWVCISLNWFALIIH